MNDLQTAIEEIARRAVLETVEQLESRIRFLEARLSERRAELLTEREAAEMIRVHIETMRQWRKEKPARIPFILLEGGDIRYRRVEIENYLSRRTRKAA